jgi:hypothetical protein
LVLSFEFPRAVQRRVAPEYVLGATAHLLAQMGDQQASLLLEDVEGLDMESEHRGLMEKDPWGTGEGDGSLYARNSNVYYLNVEPFLQPRFTPEVLQRIMPVMRSIAQRTRLPYLEFLDARPALPNIDIKTWRERCASSMPARTSPTRRARSGWTRSLLWPMV